MFVQPCMTLTFLSLLFEIFSATEETQEKFHLFLKLHYFTYELDSGDSRQELHLEERFLFASMGQTR